MITYEVFAPLWNQELCAHRQLMSIEFHSHPDKLGSSGWPNVPLKTRKRSYLKKKKKKKNSWSEAEILASNVPSALWLWSEEGAPMRSSKNWRLPPAAKQRAGRVPLRMHPTIDCCDCCNSATCELEQTLRQCLECMAKTSNIILLRFFRIWCGFHVYFFIPPNI